jgi:hypothetical protein
MEHVLFQKVENKYNFKIKKTNKGRMLMIKLSKIEDPELRLYFL